MERLDWNAEKVHPQAVITIWGTSSSEVSRHILKTVQVVQRYYAKRLRRMLPSYYATLVLVYTAFLPLLSVNNPKAPEAQRAIGTLWFNEGDGCPNKLWTNFLFTNNQVERAGCMKYAWSQAVQVKLCQALHVKDPISTSLFS